MTETPFSGRSIYFDASDRLGTLPTATARMNNHNVEQDLYHEASAGNSATQPSNNRESLGWLPTIEEPSEISTTIRHSWNGVPSTAKLRVPSPVPSASDPPAAVGDTLTDLGGNHGEGNYGRRSGSLLSRKSIFTNVDGQPISGSTFIHGAGTVGPNATATRNEELTLRAASADTALASRQKSRIKKHEAKEARRLSKIVKEEGKVEKKVLSVAINELAELQGLQKKAVKDEGKAHTAHTKILGSLRKCEAEYMEAKAKYEATLSRLSAESQALTRIRHNAREAAEQMQAKSQEVDSLRAMYSVDEREREVKLMQLTGSKSRSLFRR